VIATGLWSLPSSIQSTNVLHCVLLELLCHSSLTGLVLCAPVLLLQTNGNVLHFYDVRETQRQLRLASSDAINLVDIRFRSSTSIPLFGDDVAL